MRLKLTLLVLFLTSLMLMGKQGALQLYQMKSIADTLEEQNQTLIRQNSQLAQEVEKLRQPHFLERLIREERGYVRTDEMLLEIPKSP